VDAEDDEVLVAGRTPGEVGVVGVGVGVALGLELEVIGGIGVIGIIAAVVTNGMFVA
jgi:hypothetical protein